MEPDESGTKGVKSVDSSFRIVEFLRTHDGATISEVATALDTSKSTAHRHLKTLESHGYAVKEKDTYHVGLRFLEMGQYAKRRKSAFAIAEEVTKSIAMETGDRASFVTEENGLGVLLWSEVGEHGIFADSYVGQRFYLHSSAVGKAIISNYTKACVDEILDRHGLPELTNKTHTTRKELYEDLDATRRRGYATNHSERIPGVRAVGVPVNDENNEVIGAFGVSGPTRRVSDERITGELPEILLSAAEEFELRNRYSEPR